MNSPFLKRVVMMLIALFILSTVAHALILPRQSRCLLINLYDFEQTAGVYHRPATPADTLALLQQLIDSGQQRVSGLFGSPAREVKLMYCSQPGDYQDFGSPYGSPAVTHMHLGATVVISPDGLNADVVAHELAHAALFEQVGMLRNQLEVPLWFHEGLAMQLDQRPQFSESRLRELSADLSELPDLSQLQKSKDFLSGNIALNYATARYVVGQWYSLARLQLLIRELKAGTSFEDAYAQTQTP